jgi:hypothetical protein
MIGANNFLFRDDESLGHRSTHLVLWFSVAFYVVIALRQHRSTES